MKKTKGVRTLTGNPRKAIIKLSIPMVVAMMAHTVYNLADAIWVSGIGPEALSAVGFFFPFMMLGISVSVGIGVGGGSAISRYIGASDRDNAGSAAVHTIILTVLAAVLYTVPSLVFIRPIFLSIGAGSVLETTVSYARIMFIGSIFMFFLHVGGSLLRSEGDAARAGIVIAAGSVLNIILDPFFIYSIPVRVSSLTFSLGLGLGVRGAAYASVAAMGASSMMLVYWLIFQKSTYISIDFRRFRPRMDIIKNIFKVGFPSSLAHMSMSVMMLLITGLVTSIAGAQGVAVFTTGWRVVMIAVLPLQGMATAVTSVAGAAFGGREYGKLKDGFFFAVKGGLVIELCIAVVTFLMAQRIAAVFTWSPATLPLREDITVLLRMISLFYPAIAWGMLSGAMFQGVGKGFYSLLITVWRTLLLSVPLSFLFGSRLGMGLPGVYLGIILGSWTASTSAVLWATIFINRLQRHPDAVWAISVPEEAIAESTAYDST